MSSRPSRPSLSGKLRRVFGSTPAPAVVEAVEAPLPPGDDLIGLTVYAGDSIAFGHLALDSERVSDLMNESESFEFVDTYVQSLDDGHGIMLDEIVIVRDEIFAVVVTGPRGDIARRKQTRAVAVSVRLGPYDVTGNLHIVPGTDAIFAFGRRKMMVPLTEAAIEYNGPDGRTSSQVSTILVNRSRVESIGLALRSDIRPPDRTQQAATPTSQAAQAGSQVANAAPETGTPATPAPESGTTASEPAPRAHTPAPEPMAPVHTETPKAESPAPEPMSPAAQPAAQAAARPPRARRQASPAT